MSRVRRRDSHGFVLVIVLATLVVLTLLATAVGRSVQDLSGRRGDDEG